MPMVKQSSYGLQKTSVPRYAMGGTDVYGDQGDGWRRLFVILDGVNRTGTGPRLIATPGCRWKPV